MHKIIIILAMLLAMTALLAEKMPEFNLPDVNNKEVTLDNLLGKGPVLVDFWATWCVPCKKGMVALDKLAQKYDSLTIVVVSIDSPKDVAKAKAYLKSSGYDFVGLFDSEKKLARKLNVVNPPRTVILDKTGEIVLSHEGYELGTEKMYEAKIREMLNLAPEETKTEEAVPEGSIECGSCPENTEKPVVPEQPKTGSCGGCQ